MATTLLRMGLRSVVLKGVFEKRSIPAIGNALIDAERRHLQQEQKLQFAVAKHYMSSKRNVHHSRATASLDEESDSDSDSDDEPERTESNFWRRKMRTLHSHLDVNKDGVISYDDFMLLGERFANLGHLTTEEKKEFQHVLNEIWEEQWGEISPYNLIGVEQYLERMQHVLEDESLKKKCHNFLPFLFKAVDRNNNGEISVQEYQLFFECLGLSHDDAVIAFSHIDQNDDGKINLKEFVKHGREFIVSHDHSKPSKYFWGPLDD
ncbi:sarcoplasmic calcium-binding protein [Leptopilina boulardi]|uniref:sarcoplasmic calcium-binding protein n=1 Tax=Leptopilina boulardi TaxID=63433 RepID=UPI0021F55C14|nr:sarcoplasmic calcium-binding protein [Leptopilina boulardi]